MMIPDRWAESNTTSILATFEAAKKILDARPLIPPAPPPLELFLTMAEARFFIARAKLLGLKSGHDAFRAEFGWVNHVAVWNEIASEFYGAPNMPDPDPEFWGVYRESDRQCTDRRDGDGG